MRQRNGVERPSAAGRPRTDARSLIVDLPEYVVRRLEAVAVARGVSVEELAAETLAQVAPVDDEFAETVTETIAEHREILDRLAQT